MDEYEQLFRQLMQSWERDRDGGLIANLYQYPSSSRRGDGEFVVVGSRADGARLFQAAIDRFLAQGLDTWSYRDFNTMPLGRSAGLVTLTWVVEGAGRKLEIRQSYLVVKLGDSLKIVASVVHETQ